MFEVDQGALVNMQHANPLLIHSQLLGLKDSFVFQALSSASTLQLSSHLPRYVGSMTYTVRIKQGTAQNRLPFTASYEIADTAIPKFAHTEVELDLR